MKEAARRIILHKCQEPTMNSRIRSATTAYQTLLVEILQVRWELQVQRIVIRSTEPSNVHSTQPREKYFAASVEEYLNQAPLLQFGDKNRETTSGKHELAVFLKYLHCPECCGPLVHNMRSQLEMEMIAYNQHNPDHSYNFRMIDVVNMRSDRYDYHLYLCVTNNSAYHL